MKRVLIESPFSGNLGETIINVEYARACMQDSLLRGEAPFASHLLYTQRGILNDNIPEERKLGIEAGLLWGMAADLTAVYTNYPISKGMRQGIKAAEKAGRPIVYRKLPEPWLDIWKYELAY